MANMNLLSEMRGNKTLHSHRHTGTPVLGETLLHKTGSPATVRLYDDNKE